MASDGRSSTAESEALLLGVWREACRHVEIDEFTRSVGALLAQVLPAASAIVRHVDREAPRVETVGASPRWIERRGTRAEIAHETWVELVAWVRSAKRTAWRERALPAAVVQSLAASSAERLVGPLASEHGALGLLALEARPSERFTAEHERLFAQLLEPFACALENDRRQLELVALREAAEADKRSLLTRLGREGLQQEIVGADAGLRPVLERVDLVAKSDVPVLIFGETGSGKEVIARAIHARSPRANGPFMRVNCGAVPPELIDSELFGHEKGSFTGASATRRGWFERADEGTLFLDEIGELPPAVQVRLLRVVQEGCFERVGGDGPIDVSVRIVAATHRDLAGMVNEGAFREDLWYRLAVFPIHLPPLREHMQDVPALALDFARRAARRLGLPVQLPTADDVALLQSYDWPGNVRELGSVIDRAAILGNGQGLEVARSLGVHERIPESRRPAAAAAPTPRSDGNALPSLEQANRAHIEDALRRARGRIEGPHGAAKLLGINPHTLRARMRKLAIDWARFRAE